MPASNKLNFEELLKCMEAWVKGKRHGSELPDLPQKYLHNIRHIMNNYAIGPPTLLHELSAASLMSHSPEKALLRLERFLEAAGSGLKFFSFTPELPVVLARIFAASEVLSGRLNADSLLVIKLAELENQLGARLDKDYYLKETGVPEKERGIASAYIKAIHRVQTVQLIRICARNADPGVPIDDINRELSSLAEAVIESCLATAYDELIARTGAEHKPHSLAVLALGKLGGMELNVSSDIDLIYLYGGTEETWGRYDSLSFHTMLAERLTRILSEATDLGILYRVDTRLRADGASGPLVRMPADYFRYLEMRGEAWERQMLLKARPVAGNIELGQTFLNSIDSFIFPASITRSPNREIVELKNRIEARTLAEGSKKTHLKLVPGGIRDIEFVTQCLQLLMGGIHPEVRCTGTLPALDRLRDFKALSADEHRILSDAYTLYRRIENALQWSELLPAFTLPETQEELEELAAYLDYPAKEQNPASSLKNDLEKSLKDVRNVYNDVFSLSADVSFEEMAIYTAHHPPDDEKVKRFMESIGFNEPLESARTLSRLVFGEEVEIPGSAIHSSVERFVPKLLRVLSDMPDPGGALERFSRVTNSYKARYMLFDVLDSNPSFFDLLLSITHGSLFITDLIVNDPSLLDWLVEVGEILHPINAKEIKRELKRIDAETETDEMFTRSCLALKNREKLRIGARDISGLATTGETFRELTKVAECIVNAVFTRSFKNVSGRMKVPRDYAFCVLAAGRLGAGMMDFGSDLDLIFVYNEPKKKTTGFEAPEISIKLAQHIQSLITGGGGAYKIYDVDARLRPEGGNSVLAVSIDEYKRYLKHRASVWERLAMIRTRAVAGSIRLGSGAVEALHDFTYSGPFSRAEVKKIMEIRSAMVESAVKRYPGQINVKSGAGGITDIDFIAQSYAAYYGADNTTVRHRETPEILSALGSANFLKRHDVSALLELYSFLCDVEKTLRIGSGRSVNTLPESESGSARISRLLGFKNVRRFRKRLDDVTSLTRELYDSLMKRLLQLSIIN